MRVAYTMALSLLAVLHFIELSSQSEGSSSSDYIQDTPRFAPFHSPNKYHSPARTSVSLALSLGRSGSSPTRSRSSVRFPLPALSPESSAEFRRFPNATVLPDTTHHGCRSYSSRRPQSPPRPLTLHLGRSVSPRIRSRSPPATFSRSALLPELVLQAGCSPNGERIPGCRPFYSSEIPHSPIRPFLSARPPPDVLELIRLIPHKNPNQRFEFRRYVFPADQLVWRRIGENQFEPYPAQEFTVLSTANGDVFATFEDNTGILRGIYNRSQRRATINIGSSKVRSLSPQEKDECPVGQKIKQYNFGIVYA